MKVFITTTENDVTYMYSYSKYDDKAIILHNFGMVAGELTKIY